jgi:hypothetical protein
MRALTPEIIEEARAIRRRHRVPWTRLARSLGVNCTALRRNLDDDFRESRNAEAKRYREKNFRGVYTPGVRTHDERPSPEALADRDRRLNDRPRSLTAMILGDPPPGRSALDRRESR